LVGALVTKNAEIYLKFGDLTSSEIYDYVADLVEVLVDCGSPYRVRVDAIGVRLDPGERLSRTI
jgi:hypothetical protein